MKLSPLLVRLLAPLLLLLVTATLVLFALWSPPVWSLDVGAPGDSHFLGGFFAPEYAEGTHFRWSGPKSQLILHGAGIRPVLLDLRLHGDERTKTGGWFLSLQRNEQTLAKLTMQPGWRLYRVLLSPAMLLEKGGQPAPLALVSSAYTYVARDHRRLGAPLDWLRLVPIEANSNGYAAFLVLLYRTLCLVWGLLLVLAMPVSSNALHLVRLVLATGVALALVLWATRDPYTLAWILPNTPWMFGGATLLLIRWRSPTLLWRGGQDIRLVALALLVGAQVLLATRWSVAVGIGLAWIGIVLLSLPRRQPADVPLCAG